MGLPVTGIEDPVEPVQGGPAIGERFFQPRPPEVLGPMEGPIGLGDQVVVQGTVGRKNWLFMGSERAGKRAAVIQSLMGAAKLNGLDPAAWLKDTLEKLPAWPNSRLDELLPLRPDHLSRLIDNLSSDAIKSARK